MTKLLRGSNGSRGVLILLLVCLATHAVALPAAWDDGLIAHIGFNEGEGVGSQDLTAHIVDTLTLEPTRIWSRKPLLDRL